MLQGAVAQADQAPGALHDAQPVQVGRAEQLIAVLGMALGMPAEELAFDYGKVDARPVLRERGLLPG